MIGVALNYFEVFGPGIVATVVAALAVWILRGVLTSVWRAVTWALRSIWHTALNAIKWRTGWY